MARRRRRLSGPSNVARLRALAPDERPRFRFGVRLRRAASAEWQQVMPLPRAWPAVLVLGGMLVVFCVPLFAVGARVDFAGDDLFDLASGLFQMFWLLGWAVGVAVLAALFVAFTFATEVITVAHDYLVLRFEILRLGVESVFPATRVVGLRVEPGDEANGSAWRGPHLAFDYLGIPMACGSGLGARGAERLRDAVVARLAPAHFDVADRTLAAQALQRATVEHATVPQALPATAGAASAAGDPPRRRPWLSGVALVAANLVPLVGVWWWGWQVLDVLLLYWAESAVVGLYNVLRLVLVARWAALLSVPFFVAHYGAFMSVHLLFLFAFFADGSSGPPGGAVPLTLVTARFTMLWPALAALLLSHGTSFVVNFLAAGEYRHATTRALMREPYARIAAMQVTVIIGGMLALAAGSATPALVLLVALKLVADVRAHRRQHCARGTGPDASALA